MARHHGGEHEFRELEASETFTDPGGVAHTGELVEASAVARVAVGSYVGDDSVSQSITGVGFEPIAVFIRGTFGVSEIWARWGDPTAHELTSGQDSTDAITSFDADGFTVDDGGDNGDPNTNTRSYQYLAFG